MSDNNDRMYELEYPSPEVSGQTAGGPTLIVALQAMPMPDTPWSPAHHT